MTLRTMTRSLHFISFGMILAMTISACSQQQDTAESEAPAAESHTIQLTDAQIKELGITTTPIAMRSIGNELSVHGIMEVPPQHLLSVNAPLGGIVRKAAILPGTHVRKGDVLIQLEDPEFITLQEDYLSTTAKLDFAEQELKRQSELAKDNINARRSLEQATSDARVLRVRKKALAEQLALIGIDASTLNENTLSRVVSLKAPFNGYVTQVFVNTGSAVAPNGPLLEMVDPTHLHVELRVFERDAARVQPEQSMMVLLAGETQERKGHIHLVGTKINDDRTILVHAHLDREDPSLRPGTTLLARIETDEATSLVVPAASVVSMNGKHYIFVMRSTETSGTSTFDAVEVVKGVTQSGYVAVSAEGLSEGLVVVNQGAHRLRSATNTPSGAHH